MRKIGLALMVAMLVGCVSVVVGQADVLSDRARGLLADIDRRGMTWEVSARGTIYPTWNDTGQMMTYGQWVTGYYEVWPEFVRGQLVPTVASAETRYIRLVRVEVRDGWTVYAVTLTDGGVLASND